MLYLNRRGVISFTLNYYFFVLMEKARKEKNCTLMIDLYCNEPSL